MKMLRAGVILTLILFAALAQACGEAENSNRAGMPAAAATASPSAVRTDAEGLTLLINIPFETEDLRWKLEQKKVVAVLRFSSADAAKLVAEAEKLGASQSATIAVETWFPEELIAQGEMSGDSALKGQTYAANSFFQEPYSSGKITRIEGSGYFLLELTAN